MSEHTDIQPEQVELLQNIKYVKSEDQGDLYARRNPILMKCIDSGLIRIDLDVVVHNRRHMLFQLTTKGVKTLHEYHRA